MSRRKRRRRNAPSNQATLPARQVDGPYSLDDRRLHRIVTPRANEYPLTEENGLTHSAMWRANDFITGKVADTPLYVRKRVASGGSEIDRDHESYNIVRRKASNTMLSLEWKRATTFHAFYAAGNAFSYIKPSPTNRFSELILLDPRSVVMYVIYDDVSEEIQAGTVIYEVYQNGKKFVLPQSQMFHIRGMTYNGLWGLPFFDFVKHATGAGNVARDFAFKFFERGANPSFVVYYPRGLAPNKEDAWLASIKEVIEGIGNSHKVFPLYNDAKLEQLTTDPDKSQGLEGRRYSDVEIANFAGLPTYIVGVENANSYNSLEISSLAALDAINPWFVRFEEEANDKLRTEEQKRTESHFFEFAREEMKQIDHKTKVDTALDELNNGGLNQDEYRTLMKRPASASPNSNRYRMPGNLVYMDQPEPTGTSVATSPESLSRVRNAIHDSAMRGFQRVTNKLVRLCPDKSKLLEYTRDHSRQWSNVKSKIQAATDLVPGADETVFEDWLDDLLSDVADTANRDDHTTQRIKNLNERHLARLESVCCQFVLSAEG